MGASLLAVLVWGIYSYTRATTVSDFARAQTDLERAQQDRRALTRDLRAARTEIEDLRNQLAYQKRSVEIDAHACDEVRQSLTTLQNEVSTLREQVVFYRGMAPGQARVAGVRVQELRLKAVDRTTFSYDLTLIQASRLEKFVGGSVRMEIQGLQGATRHNLALSDLAVGDPQKLIFSMKYYEEFHGEFRLPEGFKPQRAVVTLQIDGDNARQVEESFEWNRILAGGGGNENVRQQQQSQKQ
ncbi:MAG TPA: DUF6776 family protein [Solimonas sp.]|nr:DUF6776 family protein [Solimonas sp.]